jgi:hypothetical protein
MQDTKQMVRWALLLMAIAAIVGMLVPNLGFGETLKNLNHGSIQKITVLRDGGTFDRTRCEGPKAYNDRHCANFEAQSDRK